MFKHNQKSEIEIQRSYYTDTAKTYDQMHVHEKDVHYFALTFMLSAMNFLDGTSVLDVGAGTGRTVAYIKNNYPHIDVKGVEPVAELRQVGYSKGLSESDLIAGDGLSLPFEDNSFDFVCCFGVLHHIRTPRIVIKEMLRVAKKAIFISDGNNFAQGSFLSRTLKQGFNLLGLWSIVDLIKTKGKGYTISEGDGLAYSYSIFSDFDYIRHKTKRVHILNTSNTTSSDLYKTADSIALMAIK
jgi:ubiquinone/menaquinone biosynthesis C-methylase UbiE